MSLSDKFKKLGKFLGQDISRDEEITIFEYKSVKVFGTEKDVADGAIDEEMIQQLAKQLGISATEVRRFLGSEGSVEDLDAAVQQRSTAPQKATTSGPVVRVECPDCNRTVVNRKGYCMYCGAVFEEEATATGTESTETRTAAEEVDEKYLKTDVETTQQQDDDHEDDSFMQRLTRM